MDHIDNREVLLTPLQQIRVLKDFLGKWILHFAEVEAIHSYPLGQEEFTNGYESISSENKKRWTQIEKYDSISNLASIPT